MGPIDLTGNQRRQVLALIKRHIPDTAVWAYGSRVKWTSRPTSDLDLVVFSRADQSRQVGNLREAFADSDLPFRVDVLIWDELPESFRTGIGRQHFHLVGNPILYQHASRARFGDCAVLVRETVDPTELPGDIPCVGLSHIPENRLAVASPGVAADVTSAKSRFRRGDILFGRLRPYFRKMALAQYDGICSTDIWVLRAREGMDQKFLFYQMATQDFVAHATMGSEGTRMPRAKWDHVSEYKVILPSLAEQRRIADVLGTLDDKISANQELICVMDDLVQTLFRALIVDCSRNGVEGYQAVRLGDVMEINPLRSLRKGDKAPYLDMANMPTTGHSPLSVSERPYGHGARFTNGDTLVARITPCLENGKTAYVDFLPADVVGWGSTEYIVLRPMRPVPLEFAYCLARSTSFRDYAVGNMTGSSGRQRVSPAVLAEYEFPLPPQCLLDDFGNVARLFISRARRAILESVRLLALRDEILSAALSRRTAKRGGYHALARIDEPQNRGTLQAATVRPR